MNISDCFAGAHHGARLLAAATLASLCACASAPPMPIGEVMHRSSSGQPPGAVIGAIRASRTTYALRGSDFGKLHRAGVPDPVLDYLQQSFVSDVDLMTKYWVWGDSVGGCQRCVPQQVDLANPEQPSQRPGITATWGQQPQGMPSWFTPYSAKPATLSIEDIRRMAKSGTPEAELVAAVRGATLTDVTGQQHFNSITSHPLAALSGSELARLSAEGVPDPVLDAVQNDFVGQYVELQRLRYQNWGTHTPGGWS